MCIHIPIETKDLERQLKEVVFHIGIPKTGSSALQVFLARNRDVLLTKSVDYLQIGEIGLGFQGKISSGNGAFLARSLLPDGAEIKMKEPTRYIEEFITAVEQSQSDIGIISSELFVDVDKASLRELVAGLRDRGVVSRAFYFIRSQVQFMSSTYVQQVKRHGCSLGPAEYVEKAYQHIPYLKVFSFFNNLCDIFSAENIICRSYDAASAQKSGLFHALLSALAIQSDRFDMNVEDINISIAPKEIAIMLLLNRFSPRMKFSDLVVENAARVGSVASGHVHNILPTQLACEIDRYFAKENADLAETYFQRKVLFPIRPSTEQVEPISIDDLAPSDLVNFFGGLLVRYDQRIARLEERAQQA
jgi:hypothetical protein